MNFLEKLIYLLLPFLIFGIWTPAINAEEEKKIMYWVAPMDANYRRDKPGKSPMGMDLVPVYEEKKEILYWVAPMDPNYRRDKPGKSPMGMDLIPFYSGGDEGSTITISPEVVQNLGVRTDTAELTRLWRAIDTVGYIDYDETKMSHIHLRTDGWIEGLAVKSKGERVKKGDKLFDLYSPELVNVQEEFVTALSSGNKALIRASEGRLKALGISNGQIKELKRDKKVKQTISIYAPQDGVVSELSVREGMFVKPALKVMTLADLSSVWLLAEVFERQVQWVKPDQPAEVKLSFIPGKLWEGNVQYIYPSLDAKTRTLKVRLRFENPGEELKPNMYANVKIYGGAKEDTIVIPIEGLIRTGRSERVIIDLGDGKFESREVTAGIESGNYVEILNGIKAGDRIVISGQFLIDSEASMRASFTRMSDAEGKAEMENKSGMSNEIKTVHSKGTIRTLMPDDKKINMTHDPIEELGWPSMTMDFSISENIDISNLKPNDEVSFQLEEKDNNYLITSIRKSSELSKSDISKDLEMK